MAWTKPLKIKDLPKRDQDLTNEMIEAVKARRKDPEHLQIVKNFDYFEGGDNIECSMRGGYARFEKGNLDTKSEARSPKLWNTLWRAPAQKDDEPWIEFTSRRLLYLNFTKVVAKEMAALLYRIPPVRTFKALSAELADVYTNPRHKNRSRFQALDVNTTLGGTTAIVPWYYPAQKRLTFRGFPRKNFHALFRKDDPDSLRAFCVFGQKTDPKLQRSVDYYQVWLPGPAAGEPASDFTQDADGTQPRGVVVDLGENGDITDIQSHNCGDTIPVCLWREPTFNLLSPFGQVTLTDVVQSNEQVNVMLSDLARAMDYQSFSTLFTINCGDDHRVGPGAQIRGIQTDPNQTVDARYLKPEAALTELQNALNLLIEQMFRIGRVPIAVVFGGEATSGIHLAIQWFPVQKLAAERKEAYVENERGLAQTSAVVLTRWAGNAPTASVPEVDAEINFDDRGLMPRDDESRLKQDEWDLGMGIRSPVHVLRDRDPDLSIDDAVKEIKETQRLNKQIGWTPLGHGLNNNEIGTYRTKPTREELRQQVEEMDLDEEEVV